MIKHLNITQILGGLWLGLLYNSVWTAFFFRMMTDSRLLEAHIWGALFLRYVDPTGLFMFIGLFVLGFLTTKLFTQKNKKTLNSDQWVNLNSLHHHLPKPEKLPTQSPAIQYSGTYGAINHRIASLLAAKPQAFAGIGHGVGLYEHTQNVVKKAQALEFADPLLVTAALLHDLGKLTSYDAQKKPIKDHADESIRLIVAWDEWQALAQSDRDVLILLVRYHHKDNVPITKSVDLDRLGILRQQLKSCDCSATASEKKKLVEQADIDAMVKSFWDKAKTNLRLQYAGGAKTRKTHGWRKGDRLYLMESMLREESKDEAYLDLRAALGRRKAGEQHPFTQSLIKILREEGRLIDRVGELSSKDGLFSIKSGIKVYNGILVVKHLPEEKDYPETTYDISVMDSSDQHDST